ncbi:MAG: polysaccharide deacetylase family protein [Bacillota bacterium]
MRLMILNRRHQRIWGILIFVFLLSILVIPFTNQPRGFLALVTGMKRILPIYSVDTADKKVAISFDACWGAEFTPQILDILDRYQIKTTFFLVNIWLEKYPQEAKTIAGRGHEIGLHSVTHPDFTKLSEAQMEQELKDNAQMVTQITGYVPRLFRPPYGAYDDRVITVARNMGIHVIQWDVDSLDWKDLSAEEIYHRVTSRAGKGSIVLFHNNGKHTVEALIPIIEKLQSEGYEIVPISQLMIQDDYYVDVNGVQRKQP